MSFGTVSYKISCVAIMPTASMGGDDRLLLLGLVIHSPSLPFWSFVVLDYKLRNVSPVPQDPVAGSAFVRTLIPLDISPSVLLT